VIVRLPNRWKKRTRPQVNVTIGSITQKKLGADALLDFKPGIALGKESLTAYHEGEPMFATVRSVICRFRMNTVVGNGKSRTRNAKTTSGKKAFTPIGAAVARLRKKFGMTRSQFADLIGVSPQTVTNWESKRSRLKLQERTLLVLSRKWSSVRYYSDISM